MSLEREQLPILAFLHRMNDEQMAPVFSIELIERDLYPY